MCTCVRTYISVYDDCCSDFMLQVAFIIFRSKKLITDAINDNDFLKNLDKVSVFVPPNHTYIRMYKHTRAPIPPTHMHTNTSIICLYVHSLCCVHLIICHIKYIRTYVQVSVQHMYVYAWIYYTFCLCTYVHIVCVRTYVLCVVCCAVYIEYVRTYVHGCKTWWLCTNVFTDNDIRILCAPVTICVSIVGSNCWNRWLHVSTGIPEGTVHLQGGRSWNSTLRHSRCVRIRMCVCTVQHIYMYVRTCVYTYVHTNYCAMRVHVHLWSMVL